MDSKPAGKPVAAPGASPDWDMLRANSDHAWTEVSQHVHAICARWLVHHGVPLRDIAEVAQDAVISLNDKVRSSATAPDSFTALVVWQIRAALTKYWRRRSDTRRTISLEAIWGTSDEAFGEGGSSVLESERSSLVAHALHDCIERLNDRQRQVWTLRAQGTWRPARIAAVIGEVEVDRVRQWLHRGAEKLQDCLRRHGVGVTDHG